MEGQARPGRKGIYPHTRVGKIQPRGYLFLLEAGPRISNAAKIIWPICASYSLKASTSPFDGLSSPVIFCATRRKLLLLRQRGKQKAPVEDAELNVVPDHISELAQERRNLPLLFVFKERLKMRELFLATVDLPARRKARFFRSCRGEWPYISWARLRHTSYRPALERAREIDFRDGV